MDADRLVPHRLAEYYLGNTPSLVWLLVVNAVAFLVGIRYYVASMPGVPTFLWPFYGDSPMALALGTLSIVTLLPHLGNRVADAPVNTPLAYLHTLAFVWLVKYGVWTFVALNLRPELYVGFTLAAVWAYWGILLTHALFVVEALFIPVYGATTRGALGLSLALVLLNDLLDYGYDLHPPIRYEPTTTLAALTVICSIFAVTAAWYLLPRLHGTATPIGRDPGPSSDDTTDPDDVSEGTDR